MSKIVSDSTDLVVLVNSNDEPVGLRDKQSTHEGRGALHRAISVFLFNEKGEVLLQQRHHDKPLWGGFWSNACCTHPFHKESTVDAAGRRIQQELGIEASLEFIYKFEYRAVWDENFCEHELCSVFVGHVACEPSINESEILDYQWLSHNELDEAIEKEAMPLTPWLLLEWQELRERGIPD